VRADDPAASVARPAGERPASTDLYCRAGRASLHTVELAPIGRLQVDLLLELVEA
jgi:hypothetical protein